MAIAVNQFLDKLTTNQVRTTNMFEMEVSSGYSDVDAVLKDITMYGQGFQLPSRTQNYADVGFKGFMVPVPTNLVFEQDHTITVNADANGDFRRAFLAWAAKVADPDIEGGSVFAGDRRVNNSSIIRIRLLDNDMTSVAETYKMVGVKIASVGQMQVSNNDANISTFDVTFKSIYWSIESANVGALTDTK